MDSVTLAAIPPFTPVESRVHGRELLCQVTYEVLSVSKKFPNIHALAQAASFPGCPASSICAFSSAAVRDMLTYPWGWDLCLRGRACFSTCTPLCS